MSDYDPTDFVDDDFQSRKSGRAPASGTALAGRALTREEVDTRVVEAQQKLVELKRAQEELERERATLEETRRRQVEFQKGRQEMVHSLTRGLGILEEAEFTARRDAEQMAKVVAEFREALSKIETIREESWTKDNFNVELTRALTIVENARMEWNSARLKFALLSAGSDAVAQPPPPGASERVVPAEERSFLGWCKIGLALTWPVALALLVSIGVAIALVYRR